MCWQPERLSANGLQAARCLLCGVPEDSYSLWRKSLNLVHLRDSIALLSSSVTSKDVLRGGENNKSKSRMLELESGGCERVVQA